MSDYLAGAKQDLAMRDERIPAERLVLVIIGSALRDPRQFSDADVFDIAREPDPHWAFGRRC